MPRQFNKPPLGIRLLCWLLSLQRPAYRLSPAEIERRNANRLGGLLGWIFLGPKLSLPRVIDRVASGRHGSIAIRLYYPSQDANIPLIVYFHGGGWVTGSLETHDRVCRRIASGTGALVLSVDYRLSPRHKYPVPLEDCYDAVVWASSQAASLGADGSRLIVMGDSAGGNIAASICLMARNQAGPKIFRQMLLYPAVDGTLSYPSHQTYAKAPFLNQASVQFFRAQYMNTIEDTKEPYFSPLLAQTLANLPPAFILTAEHDPLHDEAKAFSERLSAAGVDVIYQDYPGMMHAFLNFPRFCSGASAAFTAIAEDVRAAANCAVESV
ncbi:MAG: alpha/beta hydrolase [Cyanobacteria bacterium P01_F01_bin.42]